MIFKPKTTDFTLSPYTGLTRESWIEAGIYLLEGAFANIHSFEDPFVMPRKETRVTYPHRADAVWELQAEYFEGLARSFFIAAPLIHNRPELTLNGYSVREYYRHHVLRACTKGDPLCVGWYSDLQREAGDYERAYQQTVETCALVICLWVCREEIWDTYSREEKDRIAAFLTEYANGNTVPQNWRLFNMLDMAFLHMEGYPIDEEIMREHAQSILNYYAGDGWYRDGHAFDYYSCWAFQVYAPIWNLWYGYEHAPQIAARFEAYSNELMKTYADFFDRDGFTNMWGRSNIYRNAATSAFDGNLMLHHSTANPGLARRISSGSLLQFFTREDFLYEGVPTLGFYGQFTPLVQGYSCAESPFWLGKAFLCLHLPKDHPFWTARETNGTWEQLEKGGVKETTLNGPALCVTNHQANGSTILRTGKVLRKRGDEHGMWNYSKLCFHTKYPWEAASVPGVESQQYVLEDFRAKTIQKANLTLWHGEQNGVLYRRQFFDFDLDREEHWMQGINLADFPVANGIFRVDRLRLYQCPVRITLGSYGFPDQKTRVERMEKDGAKAIVLTGQDSKGQSKQLAMTIYGGWQDLELLHSTGTNPESEHSLVIYASVYREKKYGYGPYLLISQVITRESEEPFTEDEIFPVRSLVCEDNYRPESQEKQRQAGCFGTGAYGTITVSLKNGTERVIDFEGMEGNLQL